MSIVIKPKRSEVTGAPTSEDLEVGEIAMNLDDRSMYSKKTDGTIVQIANFSASDPSVQFPSGDLGSLTGASTDAFGQSLTREYDSLDTPNGILTTEDLGTLA